jgi:hypothetical protein
MYLQILRKERISMVEEKIPRLYYTVEDVQAMLGTSKGMAYKIMRRLNSELAANKYITIPGKVPKAYFEERYYGLNK